MKKHYFFKNIFSRNAGAMFAWLILALLTSKAYCQDVPDPIESEEAIYARSILKDIETNKRYVSVIRNIQEFGKLPVGQAREINGQIYVIAIDRASIASDGDDLFDAYFQFAIPGTREELIFGAKDIAFNPGGAGSLNNSKLVLLNDKRIPINEHVVLTLSGGGDNYIEWGCDGFKSVHLRGDFEFDPGLIEPEEAGQRKVRASVEISTGDLSNILASVSIPAFKIAGLKDFSFKVSNAVADMSDMANPHDLSVTGDMMPVPGNPLSWRGFYLGNVEEGLPPQLSTARGRPKVNVRNFYIDDQGGSGLVTASNLIELGDASAGGWPISITDLSLNFSKNKLNGGGFGGLIKIGFLGDEPLRYNALAGMRDGDTFYHFSLVTSADKTYQFFAGEIIVGENSRLEVTKTDHDFSARAILHGKVNLAKGALNIAQVRFQDLTLSSKSPYVHGGTFDIANAGNSRMANFPIGIDNIHLGISEGNVGIGGSVRLNFMNSEDRGFAASASFMVTASRNESTETIRINETEVQRTTVHWGLNQVTISDIALNVKVAAFTMEGSLSLFENHQVYGNGFKGNLSFSIPGPVPDASATAYFGSKDDYRYWHVDAYVAARFSLCAALDITGLMGGCSYRMRKPPQFDYYKARQDIDANGGIQKLKEPSESFAYIPDKDSGFGFMAGVSVAAKVERVLNGNVMLEIALSSQGGLRTVSFRGEGYIMHEPKKAVNLSDAGEDSSAPVWVKFNMNYNREASSFDAVIKTYVDAYGVLKGTGERGLAGEAALHVAPGEWYFYIGRPSQMFGLQIAGLAEVKAYFMMGNSIEGMPSPPPEVNEILGRMTSSSSTSGASSMREGRGFGFGAHFKTGFSFDYVVYGEFKVGAGADILLSNLGTKAQCRGGNGPIGINGWYASGQAYAFIKGDVGIRAKIFGKKRSFKIAELAAAALLEAKLPNPSWFMGQAWVRYSVLGGLVSGSASIKLELGTKCEIMGAKEIDLQVISDIKPDNNSRDVSVFARPQVSFNMPVERPFEMLNNEDKVARYRIRISRFTITDDKNVPLLLKGPAIVDAEGRAASIITKDILPPNARLTVFAGIVIEKEEGGWQPLSEAAGGYETKSTVFTTGKAPDYIAWEHVLYSYPVKRQYNFLPQEHGKGYIKLRQGRLDLFKSPDDEGKKWAVKASFTPVAGAGAPVDTDVSYDNNDVQVNFTIPEGLAKETIYVFSIKRISLDGQTANNNVATSERTTAEGADTTTIRSTSLKGVAASGLGKEVIALPFRTSMYGTFREKVEGVTAKRTLRDKARDYTTVIGQRFQSNETFDKFELEGDNSGSKSLVLLKAGNGSPWLQNKLMPFLYNDYPPDPSISFGEERRELRGSGAAPLYAVQLYNKDAGAYQLEDTDISQGRSSGRRSAECRSMYYLKLKTFLDYYDLLKKVTNKLPRGLSRTPAIVRIIDGKFPNMDIRQVYPVEFHYRLPGTNTISSTITQNINY